ncbi:MAG: Rrf2 family transcriptional regulator [Bacteroidetes bacterium]|jgi:Rrf2 family protein|nr:Rrf2 family transcriptional regulator [Bacteroidota bacterium]
MLGKTTEYAIRALVYIQLQNRKQLRPGFREVAREIDSPEHFTAKILQQLVKFDIISSAKGRGGGFYFEDMGNNTSLYRIVQLLEGEKYFSRCGFGLKNCTDDNPCPLHNEYIEIRDKLKELLHNKTIQSLADRISEGDAVLNRIVLV